MLKMSWSRLGVSPEIAEYTVGIDAIRGVTLRSPVAVIQYRRSKVDIVSAFALFFGLKINEFKLRMVEYKSLSTSPRR